MGRMIGGTEVRPFMIISSGARSAGVVGWLTIGLLAPSNS
jgi:hypothetical protein